MPGEVVVAMLRGSHTLGVLVASVGFFLREVFRLPLREQGKESRLVEAPLNFSGEPARSPGNNLEAPLISWWLPTEKGTLSLTRHLTKTTSTI